MCPKSPNPNPNETFEPRPRRRLVEAPAFASIFRSQTGLLSSACGPGPDIWQPNFTLGIWQVFAVVAWGLEDTPLGIIKLLALYEARVDLLSMSNSAGRFRFRVHSNVGS